MLKKWIKYVALWPLHLLRELAQPILPWIVVPLFSTPDKLHLRPPFEWFDTIDNPLTGDEGWQSEHLWGSDPMSTINRIRWLLRNGGNRLSYTFFGCDADDPHPFYRPFIPATHLLLVTTIFAAWRYYVGDMTSAAYMAAGTLAGLYALRWYRWDVMLGWNMAGQQHGRAKYCFVVFRFKKGDRVEFDEDPLD